MNITTYCVGSDSGSNTAAIIGGSIGGGVLVIAIIIICIVCAVSCYCCKKRADNKRPISTYTVTVSRDSDNVTIKEKSTITSTSETSEIQRSNPYHGQAAQEIPSPPYPMPYHPMPMVFAPAPIYPPYLCPLPIPQVQQNVANSNETKPPVYSD